VTQVGDRIWLVTFMHYVIAVRLPIEAKQDAESCDYSDNYKA
jgi:hypothetical protein